MITLFISSALLFIRIGAIEQNYMVLQEKLGTELLKGYNKNIKPNHKVNVTVNMFLRDVGSVDSLEGAMEFQLTFRQKWQDNRLKYENKKGFENVPYYTLLSGQDRSIWMPDTFFRNELESNIHKNLEPNQYIRIFPDGSVLHSSRITLKTTCMMNMAMFPFDRQACPLQIASYGWSEDDVVYTWRNADPVQINQELRMPAFTLSVEESKTDRCDVITTTGKYSCLSFQFMVDRCTSWYVLVYFIPTIMFFVISWAGFFVSARELTPRLLLQFGSLVCICITSYVIGHQNSPVVAYTKASDIFFGTTVLFVFCSLVDTIIFAAFTSKLEKEAETENLMERLKTGSLLTKFDLISRVVYPLCYFLFIVIYFAVYSAM